MKTVQMKVDFEEKLMENTKDILLDVQHLKKYFSTSSGMLHAVDDVSFQIERGKTLGIVGESGCGKSELAVNA